MSSSGDGDRIAQALAAGVEEAVEINQRGLVEKVRSRDWRVHNKHLRIANRYWPDILSVAKAAVSTYN